MKPYQQFPEPDASMEVFRQLDSVVVGHRERATVKELVMEGAEGEPILLRIWPPSLVPLDVGRIQANLCVSQSHIETTDRAASLVCGQHPNSESGIPAAPRNYGWRSERLVQPDGSEYVVVDGRREVGIQYRVSDFVGYAWI